VYRVPSEFIRQKNTLFGPITVAHAVGAFGGFLLGQGLGDNVLVTLLCVVLGLALTSIRVQGLVLYQFLPLVVAYLVRRLTGDVLEADAQESVAAPTGTTIVIRDEEGRPIVFQWEEG
jgi:hypothetical protein